MDTHRSEISLTVCSHATEHEMTRKHHLQHTVHNGPTCQTGRSGAALRGEHITEKFEKFVTRSVELQCTRCAASKLFAFLTRKAAK